MNIRLFLQRKKYIITAFLTLLMMTSCTNFLDIEPKTNLPATAFYKTEQDAVTAVNGLYSILASYYSGRGSFILGEDLSDESKTEDFTDDPTVALVNYTFDPTNDWITGYWAVNYQGINAANAIIAKLPGVKMEAGLKNRLMGESKFFRAYYYFRLVQGYGAVPLLLKPTEGIQNLNVSRTSVDSIYAQIFADLKDAIEVLPTQYSSDGDVGRVTKGVAEAILAKAYLFHKDWQLAADEAKTVIDSKTYSLFSDYANKWLLANANTKEFIFSIQYTTAVGDGRISAFTMPRNSGVMNRSWGSVIPTIPFYDSFDSTDYRKQVDFRTSYTFANGTVLHFPPHCWKYYSNLPDNRSVVNHPIIGYDNVLLIYAEALNEAKGPVPAAYDAINQIRDRAHLKALPENLSQSEFRQAVWQERKWELCFEAIRTWDLMRTGRLVTALQAMGKQNVSKRNEYLPIPQHEIDINPNLSQNPGW